MKVILSDGYEVNLDDNVLDDWELLCGLVAVEKGNDAALVPVFDRLLSPEEKTNLLEHLRGENGRVSILSMANCIGELLNSAHKAKNSASSQA